ncbi:unnamed protein product [Brachionus calyciflorus]|uniref:Transposase domain-containing protein n=1 Tax=Brachionus calyciflorus TaxID=104777 RepID=A0A813ZNL1_9BILA|nr:unnamed protein product [Brachionus calyciflorus]
MKQFNGFFGCTKCYQPGESLKTKNNGTVHVYPYKIYNAEGPLRDHSRYHKDLLKCLESGNVFRGVMGPCILNELKYYYPIEGTMIDYMHTILEGVVRKLTEYWFDEKFSRENFSLRPYLTSINNNLKEIRVPKFIPRVPREINSIKYWKASEYLAFILYYALPLFRNRMKLNQINHLINLIISIEYLLKKFVDKTFLGSIQILLKDFMIGMSEIYGAHSMLSGIHELVHLTRDIKNIGNLNDFNCFQFENFNRELLRLVKSKSSLGIGLINSFESIKLSSFLNFKENSEGFSAKSQNKYNIKLNINQNLIDKDEKKNIDALFLSKSYSVIKYCKINGIFYSSLFYKKTKRCDFCIEFGSKFGLIKYFVTDNIDTYAVCKTLSKLHNPFYNPRIPDLKSSMNICLQTQSIFIAPVKDLEKCAFIEANNTIYVSNMNVSHLFN